MEIEAVRCVDSTAMVDTAEHAFEGGLSGGSDW
jgi:hypothetical protein